jgi:hypothetical protein
MILLSTMMKPIEATDARDTRMPTFSFSLTRHVYQPRAPARRMSEFQSIHNCIAMYERFCDDVSIPVKRYTENLHVMTILFQMNIYTVEAYTSVFVSNPFLDWKLSESLNGFKIYRDTSAWIALLRFFELRQGSDQDELNWKLFVQRHKIFAHFQSSLATAGLHVPPLQLARLFLLLNTSNLQAQNSIEMFFSTHFDRAVKKEAFHFFSLMADLPFDRADRTAAVVVLLRDFLRTNHEAFKSEVDLLRSKESRLAVIFKQKHMQATSLRPRLRSKLRSKQGAPLALLDKFQPWSEAIRFPNIFSIMNRKRLYYTMAQTRIDRDIYIHQYTNEHDLAKTVLQYHVKNPDIDIISDIVLQTRITAEPFAELHQFREHCFNSFSVQQLNKLRLNDLLHLYIAAYQAEVAWKQVWKVIFPILSIQIIRDVESFVQQHPINHQIVMHMVFTGDEEFVTPDAESVAHRPLTSHLRPAAPAPPPPSVAPAAPCSDRTPAADP